jgi:hypothetical protein
MSQARILREEDEPAIVETVRTSLEADAVDHRHDRAGGMGRAPTLASQINNVREEDGSCP